MYLGHLKFIDSDYDKSTGVAMVILSSKDYGLHVGYAFLHPEDKEKDFGNEFVGCQFAELRAQNDYLHKLNKDLKNERFILTKFYNTYCHLPDFNKKSYEATLIRKKIKMLSKHIKDNGLYINESEQRIKDLDRIRTDFLLREEKFKAKRKSESE